MSPWSNPNLVGFGSSLHGRTVDSRGGSLGAAGLISGRY